MKGNMLEGVQKLFV